jgi:hypothetical protein
LNITQPTQHNAKSNMSAAATDDAVDGGFGLSIQLITDDAFEPEGTTESTSHTTPAIVLVLLVACLLILVGASYRCCTKGAGIATTKKMKKRMSDVEEADIASYNYNYEYNGGRNGSNSSTAYSDSSANRTVVLD